MQRYKEIQREREGKCQILWPQEVIDCQCNGEEREGGRYVSDDNVGVGVEGGRAERRGGGHE